MARNRKRAKERRARRPQPVASRRPSRPPGTPESTELSEPTERVEPPKAVEPTEGAEAQRPEPNARPDDAEHAEEDIVAGPTASHPDELAPDPLQHAAPNVELADAEAFGPSEPGDAEFQHEEELVEEELKEQAEEERERKPLAPGERPNLWLRLGGFLQGSWRELQRVQWPDRRQVAQATGVVLGFVIVAGAFLGLSDLVAQKLVNFILK